MFKFTSPVRFTHDSPARRSSSNSGMCVSIQFCISDRAAGPDDRAADRAADPADPADRAADHAADPDDPAADSAADHAADPDDPAADHAADHTDHAANSAADSISKHEFANHAFADSIAARGWLLFG